MLTNYNGTAITYDGIGNPLNWRNATNIVWYGRQMSLFTHNNGLLTNYSYNSDGIRTGKQFVGVNGNITGTVKYTLDGNTIVAENRNGTNIYYTYDDKGSIMGMIYGGENYIFSKNLQGDVIGIYNVDGQLVAKYQYNAFGEITAITDASGNNISTNASHIANVNPFRYRGYYYDTETGFYYLQSRYYDPVVGRFINCDDVDVLTATPTNLTDKNLFAYCDNNPIMRKDEGGEFWHLVAGAIAGALVNAAKTVAEAVKEDGVSALKSSNTWKKAGVSAVCGAIKGVCTASGAGVFASGVVGAITSGLEETGHQLIDNNGKWAAIDKKAIAAKTAEGFFSGIVGGKGKTHADKYLGYYNSKYNKRFLNETYKGFKYYYKMTSKHSKQHIFPIAKSIVLDGVVDQVIDPIKHSTFEYIKQRM